MSDLIVLGTDTDAGKTTFCLLWLAAFGDHYEYWKPVETGPSDSRRVAELVPAAVVHPAVCSLAAAVAPPLAARLEKVVMPAASVLASMRPATLRPERSLLMETFGGPFSPLTEQELQIALIRLLDAPAILIGSSALGAVGRALQALQALDGHGIQAAAVVLLGPRDDFAVEQLRRHRPTIPILEMQPPHDWHVEGVRHAAREQRDVLSAMFEVFRARRVSEGRQGPSLTLRARHVQQRDRVSIWHPYTSLHDPDPPLVCVGSEDEFLHLADGRRVIDGISSWWTILHGHRYAPLMSALREAAQPYDHVHFAGVTHPPAVELAELLLSTAPWAGGRVFYSDNGSTAVEVALKMAYQYWCHRGEPQRTRFVGFEGGYHGDTFGAMAVGRDPVFFGRFEPLLFQADMLPLSPERLDDVLTQRKGQVAAVILEPLVQGAGGMRMHTPALLRQIAEVTRNHGVLFIADEVMTGGGRTGTLWAHQAANISPDLICAAKTLAGGVLPLAATLAAPHIVAAFQTADPSRIFFHGHSFTAHPLACAVAVANWMELTSQPPTAPRAMETFWQEALEPLRSAPMVRDVRVRGSIAAVELGVPGGYLAGVGRQLRHRCLDEGVLLRPLGSVLYAMPPYCTSRDSLERIARAMIVAVQSLPT